MMSVSKRQVQHFEKCPPRSMHQVQNSEGSSTDKKCLAKGAYYLVGFSYLSSDSLWIVLSFLSAVFLCKYGKYREE